MTNLLVEREVFTLCLEFRIRICDSYNESPAAAERDRETGQIWIMLSKKG
jgi:hypothetical protein